MPAGNLHLGNYTRHPWTCPEPPPLEPDQLPVSVLRLEAANDQAAVPVLSWDGEGGGRARTNLLRQPVYLRAVVGGHTVSPADRLAAPVSHDAACLRYVVELAPRSEVTWEIAWLGDEWTVSLDWQTGRDQGLTELELVFPFAADVTPTTFVSERWDSANHLSLPGLLVAPDFGAYAVRAEGATPRGRLEGLPAEKTVRLVLEFPADQPPWRCLLRFVPIVLPVPPGVSPQLWVRARRGWFSLYNTTALSYTADGRLCAMAGMLGNNVLSTPVSSCLYSHAETAILLPRLSPEVHAGPLLRRSLEFWLNCETGPDGFVRYYSLSPLADPMDANAGLLIGIWAYVEITGDLDWLAAHLDRIALVARYVVSRDIDGDGLIESRQSGNLGTKDWGDSIYDTISSGHKNAYCNAMVYRAWRALADLYRRLDRPDECQRYRELAARLRQAYLPAFLSPETGWLGWWRSADGALHDYAALVVNCVAVTSGVVDVDTGRAILGRLWQELERVGFTRFDTGVPTCLHPVPRDLQPLDFGGQREDGSDTFPRYCNGGVFLQDAQRALAALYLVGERDRAEQLLNAMLDRQHQGGHFPNGSGFNAGVANRMGAGPSIMDWDGNPTCYEGFMTRDAAFLHGVFLRQASYLERWPVPPAEHPPGAASGARD